jgi:hypothetical protein
MCHLLQNQININYTHRPYLWVSAIISLNSINQLLFVMVQCGVLFEVRTEFVNILATYWMTGRSGFVPWQRQKIFLLASVSRPAPRPTQPPVQWVPGVLSLGVKRGRSMMLTTHPHLLPSQK